MIKTGITTQQFNHMIDERLEKKYSLWHKLYYGAKTLYYLTVGYYTNRKEYFIYKQVFDRVEARRAQK